MQIVSQLHIKIDVMLKSDFLHVVRHPQKLQIYLMISNGCGHTWAKLFKTMIQLYLKMSWHIKLIFLHMWLGIHKYICIRFNLFIWVWSDESDGHGHVKSNFQHWIWNVRRLNWAVMLFFCIWVNQQIDLAISSIS